MDTASVLRTDFTDPAAWDHPLKALEMPAHLRAIAQLLREGNMKTADVPALNVEDVLPATRRGIPVIEQANQPPGEAVGDREQGPLFAAPSGKQVDR
ncbi:hypothetical protein ACFVT2_19100 [Streptomyces sp. NPDC058000]|uniref:hypothetical protein n=1 Tax=Streptomyces sp. NPDC058000 TaxID=3346299 RepID=UPI0036EEB989